jgi:hypothetical protein
MVNVDDLILSSVDDHLIEPPDLFVNHLPAKYLNRAPKLVRNDEGNDVWVSGEVVMETAALNAVAGRPKEKYGLEGFRHGARRVVAAGNGRPSGRGSDGSGRTTADVVGRIHAGGEHHRLRGVVAPSRDRARLPHAGLLSEARPNARRRLLRPDVLRRTVTLADLAGHRATLLQGPRFVGTGPEVADQMQEWFEGDACDGFVIDATHVPELTRTWSAWSCPSCNTAACSATATPV